MEKFSYVIGRYWDAKKSQSVAAYASFSNTVHFGTHKEASDHAYRISKETGKRYTVFRLMNVGSYDPDPC